MKEVVNESVYLGTFINKHTDELKNNEGRTGLTNKSHYSLLPVMKSREVHR